MIIIKHISDLKNCVNDFKSKGHKIGFIPTMGALHQGHISLIETSKTGCGATVCSIFVNPTQFNNKEDFERYPITIEDDINVLEASGCDILFLPSVEEMYPSFESYPTYHLGELETILEGKYRPGHFQGVCNIVDKLLNAVMPDTLYLGQKDYQQCLVIQKLVHIKKHDTSVEICQTVRENDGLAKSSRNMRLNALERKKATIIFDSLKTIKENIKPGNTEGLRMKASEMLSKGGFRTDYVEVADAVDLQPIHIWDGKQKAIILVAAFIDQIRLIDNMAIN